MRIAVVTSDVPFVEGGHLTIARATVRALKDCGHEADLVTTPQNRFGRQFRAYLATRLTDVGLDGLGRKIDQVISFRFPSYAVRHERHACWLNHRLREYYDLWPMLKSRLGPRGLVKESLRRWLIHRLDNRLLRRNVTKLFAQSKTIQDRLRRWGRIPSEVLYPPPPQRKYRTDGYEPVIFAVSRLQYLKRLDLLVEAMGLVRDKRLRAVIIGEGPEKESLSRLIRERGLERRVSLLGAAEEEAVLRAYASCRAVFFCPRQEDYGLVTVEAFASRKAVITATDSGGPAEIVRDGQTGFVVPPRPEAVAAKLDLLASDRRRAEAMGERAFRQVSGMTWERAVKTLLGSSGPS
ncbi:MAG: glycosyltransferase family 4 protein [Candidatus Aminicenantes bacterium]|nr:glycosyltransferase family 4 protein [Candidatus Aminicenantes bacterium]